MLDRPDTAPQEQGKDRHGADVVVDRGHQVDKAGQHRHREWNEKTPGRIGGRDLF